MNPLYRRARFRIAAARPRQFPPDEGREVAFVGRSNAGKSSTINRVCDQKALARTSKTPGRTQQIVFFDLDGARRLVDLPGYGYAKVPEGEKTAWGRLIEGYLHGRRSLCGIVLVTDARHPGKPFDVQMIDWCAQTSLPVLILLNKADKLGRSALSQAQLAMETIARELQAKARILPFSALKGTGVEVTRQWLDAHLAVAVSENPADKKKPRDRRGEAPGA